jgi:hypothetical protein
MRRLWRLHRDFMFTGLAENKKAAVAQSGNGR